MEFIVCMLLASLVTGGRIGVDIVHGLRGTTPPHVEKARIKAERERIRAAQSPGGAGKRSSYAAEKPRLRDVAAVYWGDALTDVIDAHNRKREAKRNPAPQGETSREGSGGVPLWKQVRDLLVRPVGEPGTTTPDPVVAPPVEKVPTWECQGCHLDFTGPAPADGRCVPCSAGPAHPPSGEDPGVVHDSNEYKLPGNNSAECVKCGWVGLDYPTPQAAVDAMNSHPCVPGRAPDEARARLHASLAERHTRRAAALADAPASLAGRHGTDEPIRSGWCRQRIAAALAAYDAGDWQTADDILAEIERRMPVVYRSRQDHHVRVRLPEPDARRWNNGYRSMFLPHWRDDIRRRINGEPPQDSFGPPAQPSPIDWTWTCRWGCGAHSGSHDPREAQAQADEHHNTCPDHPKNNQPATTEGDTMTAATQSGEVTGIPSAVHYMTQVAATHTQHGGNEQLLTAMHTMNIGPGDVSLVQAAQEASRNAADLWTTAATTIEQHNAGVREGYSSAPDAADKQHQMAE